MRREELFLLGLSRPAPFSFLPGLTTARSDPPRMLQPRRVNTGIRTGARSRMSLSWRLRLLLTLVQLATTTAFPPLPS